MATQTVPLSGLARRLVEDGILDADTAQTASEDARKAGLAFVSYLIRNELANPRSIATSASEEFGVPIIDLSAFDLDSIPKDLVKERLIRQHNALPLIRRGVPAVRRGIGSDESAGARRDQVPHRHQHRADPGRGRQTRDDHRAVPDAAGRQHARRSRRQRSRRSRSRSVRRRRRHDDDVAPTSATDDTPIVRFVNKMLLDAIKMGAVRHSLRAVRKDLPRAIPDRRHAARSCKAADQPSARVSSARLKVMSELDISERRLPQDGRIKMKLSKTRSIDFRVNTLPTLWGEKVVLRILDPASAQDGGRSARIRRGREAALHGSALPAAGDDSGDRSDGKRQDRHAVYRAQHPQQRRTQHRNRGGSGRNQPGGHQPGQREPQGRLVVRRPLCVRSCARTRMS